MPRRALLKIAVAIAAVLFAGFLIPEQPVVPVEGASVHDWNAKSFWFEPWGASGVHKGIDIFAPHGRRVRAAVAGVVVFKGELGRGGNVVAVLGPKWRIHYYAHLAGADSPVPWVVSKASALGAVGTTGNAAGKPPHLHYAVLSIVPLPWRYSSTTQGWKRMFFLDPDELLKNGH